MSRIDNLIAEMCPEGVEFRPLGSLARRNKGFAITATQMRSLHVDGAPIKVFAAGNTVAHFPEESVPHRSVVREPSIIVKSRGHIGFAFHPGPFAHKNELWSYTLASPEVHPRFVYHYLLTQVPSLQAWARATSVKLPQLSVGDTDNLRIPVPPMGIQREIASILDKMEKLQAELQAELQARSRQYEFYRDSLLDFHDAPGVRWMPMGEAARIIRGASPRPIQAFLTESVDGVPWIKIGDVPSGGKYITATAERVTVSGAAKSRRVRPGDFVLSNSMSFGRPYISKIEGCIHDGWLAISDFETSFLPDFLYHLLRSSSIQAEFARRAGAGTVQNLNADIVKSVVVPVPPRAVQERVVGILDRFDVLVNDLSVGLPAEIAGRRQQYEYYRDKLLTFPERSDAA